MSYRVKERIGLPVWDGDGIFVVGTKHFLPGTVITDADFDEAKQDEDERDMLIHYNTFTEEQWTATQRLEELAPELKALQEQAADLTEINYEAMTLSVSDENREAYDALEKQITELQAEKSKLEEVLA